MMEISVVSLDAPWREFICTELLKVPPFENGEDGGKHLDAQFLGKNTTLRPSHILENTSGAVKRAALFTHPGCGALAESFREAGVSIINGGELADAIHFSSDFATLQAAKHRFFVAPAEEGESKNVVLVRTRRGIVPVWLEYIEHRGLLPTLIQTQEGITLQTSVIRDEVLERKIESLCRSLGYIGFLFLEGKWHNGEFSVERISPYGPEAFWPAFFSGYVGNISKFFFKLENSRKLMSKLEFRDTTTLRGSLAPYPYHSTPWVENDEERKFVELQLARGALGHQMNPHLGGVTWLDVNENYITTGPEVCFISKEEFSQIKATAEALSEKIKVQIKELK